MNNNTGWPLLYPHHVIGEHSGQDSWKETLVAVGGKVLETFAVAAGMFAWYHKIGKTFERKSYCKLMAVLFANCTFFHNIWTCGR